VVVNGLLGGVTSGRHVVDTLISAASARHLSIVAARLQCSDVLVGYNLYAQGLAAASRQLSLALAPLLRTYPHLSSVSLIGSSFGGLVVRHAAPSLPPRLRLRALVQW
jgi:hypothetical protein